MYKCIKCNSPEVETLTWVDLNTNEAMGEATGEYYCRMCGSHTDVLWEEEDIVSTEKPNELNNEENINDS